MVSRRPYGLTFGPPVTRTWSGPLLSGENRFLGDCRQLKSDADSYNDNRRPEQPIQVIFDFSLDLAELEAARTAAA